MYAIPVTKSKLTRLSVLREQVDLKLLVNNEEILKDLAETKLKWEILIEVSTGYERTGLDTIENKEQIKKIAQKIVSDENSFGEDNLYPKSDLLYTFWQSVF